MTEEMNKGLLRNNSSLVVRAGLERETSELQVLRPNPIKFSHFLYKFVLQGLGHTILGNFSTYQIVIELSKIPK